MPPWLALGFGVVLNAGANVLIKLGMSRITGAQPLWARAMQEPALWAGLMAFGLALGCYSFALSRYPLSLAYPIMTGLGMALVYLASAGLFHEAIGPTRLAGAGLILAGVVLLSRGAP